MEFVPNDWSNLSYSEVKKMIEDYNKSYMPKSEDFILTNSKTVDETEYI